MKIGDMILVKSLYSVVEPNSRYFQGIVVESQPRYGTVMVRWHDGMIHLEEPDRLKKYYEVISNETR